MDKELLNKYFRNECTPAEARKVLEWINSRDNREDILNSIDKEWRSFEEGHFVTPQNFDSLSDKINARINSRAQEKKNSLSRIFWVAAASVTLIATLSIYFLIPDNNFNGYSEEITLKGERTTIFLSDGSSILLDADSRIIYPQELTNENRQIYLEGQAFFKLTSSQPITINSNNLTTVAQASSFSVSAFPERDNIVIAVEEGTTKVSQGETRPLMKLRMPKTLPLTKLRPSTVVKAKEYIAYNKEGDTLEKETYLDEKQVFGWKDGIIYFKNADSREITTTLERWYGVEVCFEGEKEVLYSGEFTNQKIEDILNTIGNTSKVEYRIGEQCIEG